MIKIGGRQLPEGMTEEVLAKLPVKCMIRSQSVCKSWFEVVKSSRLAYNHLLENQSSYLALCFLNYSELQGSFFLYVFMYNDGGIDNEEETSASQLRRLCKGVDRWNKVFDESHQLGADYELLSVPVVNYEFPVSYEFLGSSFCWVGHCNGILCLTDFRFIVLVNPLLKEVKTLVKEERCRLVGFGFDDTSGDYKVVRISVSSDDEAAEVYSLRSNAWRKLDEFPFAVYDFSYGSTFFKGAIYWCARMENSKILTFGGENARWKLLTFNMATESFEAVEFPLGWCGNENTYKVPALFALSQESLALVPYCRDTPYPDRFVVWTMNRDVDKDEVTWTKLYSIESLPGRYQFPVCFPNKHKFLYETRGGKLVMYDLLTRRHYVFPFNSQYHPKLSLGVGVCAPTFVSVNNM